MTKTFTGEDLCTILQALKDAKAHQANERGICPSVRDYIEDLIEIDLWEKRYDTLIIVVKGLLVKEGYDPKSLE